MDPVSWLSIVVLALGSYLAKAAGVLAGASSIGERARPFTALVPAALFAGLVAVLTFDIDGVLGIDARLAGVAVAGVLAWRRAPFVITVLAAMAVTALLRM